MPTSSEFTQIGVDEQQRMIDMVAEKMGVDPAVVTVQKNGYIYVSMPEGVDAAEVTDKINAYATQNALGANLAVSDRSNNVSIGLEDIRRLAGRENTSGFGIEGYLYHHEAGPGSPSYPFIDALAAGGTVIHDRLEAQNPEIPPKRIAENLEATLGGMPVSPHFGGNYAINVNATPDAIDRITSIIDNIRETAGLNDISVGTVKSNGQIILNGTSADMNALNTALLNSGRLQDIALIVAENPMQYDRQAHIGEIDPEQLKKIAASNDPKPLGYVPIGLTDQQIADLKKKASDLQGVKEDLAVQALDEHAEKGYVVTENTKTKKTNVAVEAIAESLGVKIDKDGDLTKTEIQALQEKVGAAKNSKGEFDGIIGPDTLAQIKKAMSTNKVTVMEVEAVGMPSTAGAAKTTSISQDMA